MFSMFSPDSRFMQLVGRICDLIELNILFLITCLPVFTVGAACSALYTMCFRLMREDGGSVLKGYFSAFRKNFRQSTGIWLILLMVTVPALVYTGRAFQSEGLIRYTGILFLLIAVLGLLTGSCAFPWISQFHNSTRQVLQNSLALSISNLPRFLCILAIHLLPAALWVFRFELFQRVSFLWLALYFAAAAYMTTGLLWNVFKPYYAE